jgi:hypothetical protein
MLADPNIRYMTPTLHAMIVNMCLHQGESMNSTLSIAGAVKWEGKQLGRCFALPLAAPSIHLIDLFIHQPDHLYSAHCTKTSL